MRHTAGAGDVTRALDDLEATDLAVQRATLQSLGIGGNDARVLRFLLERESTHDPVTPGAITELLGISSPATTALVDRLADAGWVTREPHPQDRRSVVIRATIPPGAAARRLLAVRRVSVALAASRLGASDRRVVADFLDDVRRAQEHYLSDAQADAAAEAAATT